MSNMKQDQPVALTHNVSIGPLRCTWFVYELHYINTHNLIAKRSMIHIDKDIMLPVYNILPPNLLGGWVINKITGAFLNKIPDAHRASYSWMI